MIDIDATIAEKIMGWKGGKCTGKQADGGYCLRCGYKGNDVEHEEIPPHYSTDLNLAMKALLNLDTHFTLTYNYYEDHPFNCTIQKEKGISLIGLGDTAIQAICEVLLSVTYIDKKLFMEW